MEQEDSESQMLKDAMSFKKDKHRVEIRKKNIYQTLKNKRVNHIAQFTENQNLQSNNITNSVEVQQGSEITLQFYVDTINEICQQGVVFANQDKILRCLKTLRNHIFFAIRSKDQVEQDQQLIQFMGYGGCDCILQFFSELYDEIPALQAECATIIGNIYSFTKKPILNLFKERNICRLLVNILSRQSERLIQQHETKGKNTMMLLNLQTNNTIQQSNYQSDSIQIRNELLCELFRTLSNVASESYEDRLDLVQNGFMKYINSELFNKLCQQLNVNLIEQIVFLVKNMVNEQPRMSEEIIQQFIPVIAAFFQIQDLPLEATYDMIIAIRSYANKDYTVSRAKMLSNRDIFIKIHELIDYSKNNDLTNLYYSLQTLYCYMKFSDRQTEYVFNLNGDTIFKHLEFYLKSSYEGNLQSEEDKKSIIDIQIQVIQILHSYVLCEDECFFEQVYQKGFDILKLVINISIQNSNYTLKKRTSQFLFSCISKANYEQQQNLVKLGILQPIKDAVQSDDVSLIIQALQACTNLLGMAESQIGQSPDFAEHNYVREILDNQYQFKQVIESIQGHPNNELNISAAFILDNYYHI